MRTLTLKNRLQGTSTVVDNDFIDKYMIKANGEYVKVFLVLLRHLQNETASLTVSKLADFLDCTEKDICRAFRYWERAGLLKVEYDEDDYICGLSFGLPEESVEKEKPAKKVSKKSSASKDQEKLKQLYFVAEQYLGKTLSGTDIRKINYFLDELGFSIDLIEYLIEYCVDNGHKNMRYIETVALKWAEENITTVDEAKESSTTYTKNHYVVLNAFGIKGRGPATVELNYIRRWMDEYGFSLDLIVEACNRTIENTHEPDFKYTDKILKNWMQKNVKTLSDVASLDASFKEQKTTPKKGLPKPTQKSSTTSKFKNFEGRSYDMESLEQQLLNMQ